MIRYACLGLMVAALSVSGYAAGIVFDVLPLELFGATEGRAMRVNESLQIFGTAFWDLNNNPDDGVSHPVLPPFSFCGGFDLNNIGFIVGWFLSDGPRTDLEGNRPGLYNVVTRTWMDLGTLADDNEGDPIRYDGHPWDGYNNEVYDAYAMGINNHNQIVGLSCPPDIHDAGFLPVLWSSPGAAPIPLSTTSVPGTLCKFYINDNGDIAGNVEINGNNRAVRGSAAGGGLTPLPIPAGYDQCSGAYAINEEGVIVGYVRYPGYPIVWHGAKWDAQNNVEILEPKIGIAMGINDRGQIVGTSLDREAVLWEGHQVYNIDRLAYQTGWDIYYAEDINNDGVIVGWGAERSTGRIVPLMFRERYDEQKPSAEYNDNDRPTGGANSFVLEITYLDDGMIDSDGLDDEDIRVTGPNGFDALAVFDHIDDGEPRQGLRTWLAYYRLAAPGGSWDNADLGTYTIHLESNQVTDMSGRYADEGDLGTFVFGELPFKLQIRKGILYGPGSTVTHQFRCWADVRYLEDYGYPVTSLRLCSPAGVWYPLNKTTEGWVYEKNGVLASDTAVFGDGIYKIETVAVFDDSPFTMEDDFVFRIPNTSNPLPQPAQQPSFVAPIANQENVASPLTVQWAAVTDPSVNSIELSIRNSESDETLLDQLFSDPARTSFSSAWLTPERRHMATLFLRHGYDNQFVGNWSCSFSKFSATSIAFTAAPADPDINGDAAVNLFDMSVLQDFWLRDDCAAANQWCDRADLNRDDAVTILDLLIIAEGWLQNP
jgi:hypothetical protein